MAANVTSSEDEMGAYEALWCEPGATFKRLAEKFAGHPGRAPSAYVDAHEIQHHQTQVSAMMDGRDFEITVHGQDHYPLGLRDAKYPAELIYYTGDLDILSTPTVAVVGTRKPTSEGIQRTRQLVRHLVNDGYTIVSGLAAGIDTVAHETALELGGRTIAVIGTPLSEAYPKRNQSLQAQIGSDHLVVSPVPFVRYSHQHPGLNRLFFPERNIVMSALTQGSIIVEASDTSGTRYQVQAALHQGRSVFILESCFTNPAISWPERYAGYDSVYRVKTYDDIRSELSAESVSS